MSARPGRIKEVISIDLDRDPSGEIDVRASRDFATYRHHIWSLLRQQHHETDETSTQELAHA
jgi:NitT/TauT family transport system ATP-binding protein